MQLPVRSCGYVGSPARFGVPALVKPSGFDQPRTATDFDTMAIGPTSAWAHVTGTSRISIPMDSVGQQSPALSEDAPRTAAHFLVPTQKVLPHCAYAQCIAELVGALVQCMLCSSQSRFLASEFWFPLWVRTPTFIRSKLCLGRGGTLGCITDLRTIRMHGTSVLIEKPGLRSPAWPAIIDGQSRTSA